MAHLGVARSSLYAAAFKWLRKAMKKGGKYHHIFRGEVRREAHGGWVAQGLHHRFLGHTMPDRLVGPITRHGYGGTYAAEVEMKGPNGWVKKTGGSTFFPDNWTPQTVVASIDQAFAYRINLPGGRRWRGMRNGIMIDGSYHRNGSWNSAWPVV